MYTFLSKHYYVTQVTDFQPSNPEVCRESNKHIVMKKNMGKTDRVIRIIVGLLAGAAGIYFHSWWGLVGAVLVVTAAANFCPLYLPFGISTRKS